MVVACQVKAWVEMSERTYTRLSPLPSINGAATWVGSVIAGRVRRFASGSGCVESSDQGTHRRKANGWSKFPDLARVRSSTSITCKEHVVNLFLREGSVYSYVPASIELARRVCGDQLFDLRGYDGSLSDADVFR